MKIKDRISYLKKHLAESEKIIKKFPDAVWKGASLIFSTDSLFLNKEHITDLVLPKCGQKPKYNIFGSYYHSNLVNKYVEKAFVCVGYEFEDPGLFIIPFYEWSKDELIFCLLDKYKYYEHGGYLYFSFKEYGQNLKQIVCQKLRDEKFSEDFIFDLWSKIEPKLKEKR
jgi:hypothetical protein